MYLIKFILLLSLNCLTLNSDTFSYRDSIFQINQTKTIILEFGLHSQKQENIKAMDSLYTFLVTHKTICIEIGTYVGCVGSDRYNQLFTQHIANKSKEYLVFKGIDDKRIVAKGYASKPSKNCESCEDCSHETLNENNNEIILTIIAL